MFPPKTNQRKLELEKLKGNNKNKENNEEKKNTGYILLPEHLKHPKTKDDFYPVEYDKIIFDCF